MPTIVISSPKGGAGKSTAAVILGTEFAAMGIEVTMLDCDFVTGRETALEVWAGAGGVPAGITLKHRVGEAEVIREIKAGEGDGKVVIVDLGGAASRLATRAISQADLVLVPMRPTSLDVKIGAAAIQMVAEEEETLGRSIPFVVALSATKAIKSKAQRGLTESLIAEGVEIIDPPLMERGAFAAFFEFGGDIRSMPPQGSHDAAVENARQFAEAVLQRLAREADQ